MRHPHVNLARAVAPAVDRRLEVVAVLERDMHQDVEVLARAIGVALTRPGGRERPEAAIAGVGPELVQEPLPDCRAVVKRDLIDVERAQGHQHVQRPPNFAGVVPGVV
jgi:hypothetical protein